MATKSEKLKSKLADLREQIAAVERKEAEAEDRELLRLVHRAGCMRDVIAYARQVLEGKVKNKAAESYE